jgi:hypothetical protein
MGDNENNVGQPQNTGANKRNVILAHDETTGEFVEPPTVSGPVNIGGIAGIELPDLETQKAGFYLPEAERELLLMQYPRTFKALLPSHTVPARVPPRQGQGQGGGVNLNLDDNAGGGPDNSGQQGGGQS